MPAEDLKTSINNALFPLVANEMTIREFEELACEVHRLLTAARWEQ